jgi:Ser/Thr protein kinase RdoA (MazF antagonist)
MLQSILHAYGLQPDKLNVTTFGSGLINDTWRVKNGQKDYILQRINSSVFKHPEDVAYNIQVISQYLRNHHPEYLFVVPVKTTAGEEIIFNQEEGYFRMFPFVHGSHTVNVVQSSSQAYEAARQFGKFTNLLSGFDTNQLKITIPDFHNLSLRYRQFEHSLNHGNIERIKEAGRSIKDIKQHFDIVQEFEHIKSNSAFKLRVTHHDTKISNVLFNDNDKGLCVIDLDTVMPGYFISDVGDMLRTYLPNVSEEEKDLSTIEIREEIFKAIIEGYGREMKNELSAPEKEHFIYAGKFMIYMQAIRFLADYFNNDIYYGAKYPDHNFIRANNQLVLLKKLVEKEKIFNGLKL